MKNERKIGIIISYFNILLHTIIGFIYVPVLLYYVGKNEFGIYQLIGSFIAYFSIMDFGLSTIVTRFYSKYRTLNDNIGMENIIAISFRAYLIIALILIMLGFLCYFNFEYIFAYSMSQAELSISKELFLILLFNIFITMFAMIFKAVINAHEKFIFLKSVETIELFFQPFLVLTILQEYPSVIAVALVQSVLNVILIIIRMIYCFKKLKISIKFHYLDNILFKELKKLSLSIFLVMVVDQIFFKTSQITLGIICGPAEVAIYSIASFIYMNYMTLSTAISGVYLPYITELIVKNQPIDKLSELFIQIGRWQFYLLMLVLTGFVIFGKDFINIWAGKEFLDSYSITLLIIIPFTIDLIQNIGLSILQVQNKYNFRAKVYLCMGILNIIFSVPMAICYGGVGCAFATGLCMFIGNGLIMNFYYYKVIKLNVIRFWKEIAGISIKLIILLVLAYSIYMFLPRKSFFDFCFGIFIYLISYSVIAYKYCMTDQEKKQILNFLCNKHI